MTVGNRRLDNKQVNRQYQCKYQLSIFPDESQDFWFSGKINIQSVSRHRLVVFSWFLGMFLRLDYETRAMIRLRRLHKYLPDYLKYNTP